MLGAGKGRREALLTHLSRRAPAWRALFLSALFALVGAWAVLTALVWVPHSGGSKAWASVLAGGSPAWVAPAWLAQLRAALLRASL